MKKFILLMTNLLVNLKFFFKDPNLRKTYINNAGLGFIYSIWDMLPLLMLKLGAALPIIGMTKTLMGCHNLFSNIPSAL